MIENRLGGRGKCTICKKWIDNVSYHEAWECGRPNKLGGIHMNVVSKFFWELENDERQMKFDFMGD